MASRRERFVARVLFFCVVIVVFVCNVFEGILNRNEG